MALHSFPVSHVHPYNPYLPPHCILQARLAELETEWELLETKEQAAQERAEKLSSKLSQLIARYKVCTTRKCFVVLAPFLGVDVSLPGGGGEGEGEDEAFF